MIVLKEYIVNMRSVTKIGYLFMQIPVIFTDKYGLYTCLFCGQVFLDSLFLNFFDSKSLLTRCWD